MKFLVLLSSIFVICVITCQSAWINSRNFYYNNNLFDGIENAESIEDFKARNRGIHVEEAQIVRHGFLKKYKFGNRTLGTYNYIYYNIVYYIKIL